MIIDLILDRQNDDKLISAGYTHRKTWAGDIVPIAYSPEKFYRETLKYGNIGDGITRAMDYGTEADVKKALCDYIRGGDYNPEICDYIRAVNWLTA